MLLCPYGGDELLVGARMLVLDPYGGGELLLGEDDALPVYGGGELLDGEDDALLPPGDTEAEDWLALLLAEDAEPCEEPGVVTAPPELEEFGVGPGDVRLTDVVIPLEEIEAALLCEYGGLAEPLEAPVLL